MADKTPVQDKLSKILAELMWCLSGTEEEDEYAGQVYLQMENCGEGEGGDEDMLNMGDDDGDDGEEDDENVMEGEGENGKNDMVEFDNDEEDSDPRALFGTNYNEEDEMNDSGVFEDEDGDTMEIIEMDNDGDTIVEMENINAEEDDDEEEEDDEIDEELRIKQMNESHCRGAHLVSLYISTFLRTVRREWGNVDKHRVDKFYTAVRYMVSEVSGGG